jgi:hypothetical protein
MTAPLLVPIRSWIKRQPAPGTFLLRAGPADPVFSGQELPRFGSENTLDHRERPSIERAPKVDARS